jgi:transcriptional regulator with XRE-family HTH domain
MLVLSQQLRRAMSAQGVSQADLAGRSGVARKTIVNILNGSHAARSDIVQVLAYALGLNVSQLVEASIGESDKLHSPLLTADEARLVILYRESGLEGRRTLLSLGEELASRSGSH